MDDMGDLFRDQREASAKKRANNRAFSAKMLTNEGISFVSKNDGAHLIVEERFDFWPGTGLWIERGATRRQRGVRNLIDRIHKMRGLQ